MKEKAQPSARAQPRWDFAPTGAQGALEYLLLIGGAVVVAAVVITLLAGLSATSANTSQTLVRNMQKTQFINANADSAKFYVKMEGDFNDSSQLPSAPSTFGSPTFTAGHGAGQAASFNGSSYVYYPGTSGKISYPNGFTYMAWVKPSAPPGNFNMIMGQYYPYTEVSNTVANPQKLHLSVLSGWTPRDLYSTTTIPLNQWTHVAATQDSSGYMKVFVNGVEDSNSGPYPSMASGADFAIGTWYTLGSDRFTGQIDEAVVLNYALAPSQIKIFANG